MSIINKSLASLWPSIRISLALVLISMSLILIADFLQITPNHGNYELEKRKQLSESLAVLFSTLAADSDVKKVRTVLSKVVLREDELVSAGFRMESGRLLFESGPHAQQWGDYKGKKSSTTHVLVPVFRGKRQIGVIELRFMDLFNEQSLGVFNNPTYKLVLFVFVCGFFSFLFFILRTLRQIDPSSVVPDRVNAAFDTLSEGLVILDDKEQIVLANIAFCETVRRNTSDILGFKLSELSWKNTSEDVGEVLYPWLIAMASGQSTAGEMLVLEVSPDDKRTLTVNCAPIQDSQGEQQGILLTFDDVTELEMQKQQLQVTVLDLESSKNEIQRQNKELHYLATRDPMTGCLNRRSFNDQFAESFTQARSQDEHLTCLMVDIDHFKLVNDNYGHGVGDEVIKLLANILLSSTRDQDIVSRYGGEEFCIILPGIDVEEAVSVAERIRLKIKQDSISTFEEGPHITASLGVSSIHDNAIDPAKLNEQADQALYVAKETGRNRVISWTPDAVKSSPEAADAEKTEVDNRISISDHANHEEEINQLHAQIEQLEKATAFFSEQLKQEQNYDKLTGLPNQALFYDRIKQAVEISARQGKLTAILIIDVDVFSQANNSFGLEVAEKMFTSLSDKLTNVFRKTDSIALFDMNSNDLTISRFDGDEFGVLLTDLDDRMVVTWVVKRIFDALSQPLSYQDKQINVACKIGISVFPDDASLPEEMLSHANTAKSFVNKDSGANGFQFYDAEMQTSSLKYLSLESEIKRAIKNEEWVLYYQPKLDIKENKIKGVEALIRWNHPERGILLPVEFIDFAEQRGLIVEIGDWVLRTACKQAKIWADLGLDIKVAVNLSAVQLQKEKLSDQILEIIKETQIKPQHLELEVTETMLMDNVDVAINTLNRLNARGIDISIDDFGTGYSSLGYLKQLPVNTLKIDRVFIKDIMTDDYDKNIVKTIISLAHGMDLKVIAEGVETQAQLNLLQQMACDEIQGYLLSKPVDAGSVTPLLIQ
ncbi:MAG: diguanylate cyclase domain-containing protein [Methylococcaceae bacterium]